jgi:hypothetical protein
MALIFQQQKMKGLINQIHELKDKILGCWCKPDPCHGDFLVELANSNELNLTN